MSVTNPTRPAHPDTDVDADAVLEWAEREADCLERSAHRPGVHPTWGVGLALSPNSCAQNARWLRQLRELAQQPGPDALAIAVGLGQAPAPVADGMCLLCDATAPGGATTLPDTQHRLSCLWRQARELESALVGWNRPPS